MNVMPIQSVWAELVHRDGHRVAEVCVSAKGSNIAISIPVASIEEGNALVDIISGAVSDAIYDDEPQ